MKETTPATKPTSKPATKTTRKPQKITIPRLFNALEDIVNGAGLGLDATIEDLYKELEATIVRQARA